jgi:hypothetical protein
MVYLPELAATFFFEIFFENSFVNFFEISFDDRGLLPTARSNSATAISSSRVLRFGFRRRYSSLKAR